MGAIRYFKFLIMLQLFYSLGVTFLVYSLQPFGITTLSIQSQPFINKTADSASLQNQIQNAMKSQMNIPLIDLGALVFYSGNILVDMFVNFFTMLPGMFNLVIDGFSYFFAGVEVYYIVAIKVLTFAFLTIMYFIMLIQFLLSVRARGATVM